MSNTNTSPIDRQEFEELLPWYVAGTLDRADADRVDEYLRAHPDVAMQIGIAEDERGETIAANESIGGPSAGALDRLMQSIGEPETKRVDDWSQRLGDWFAELWDGLAQPAVRLAAVTAGVLIVAQFMALAFMMQGESGSGYRTASGDGPKDAGKGSYAIVRFAEDVPIASISTLLESKGVVIVSGPKPGGLYTVRLTSDKVSDDEVTRRIDDLLANENVVTFAAPGAGPDR